MSIKKIPGKRLGAELTTRQQADLNRTPSAILALRLAIQKVHKREQMLIKPTESWQLEVKTSRFPMDKLAIKCLEFMLATKKQSNKKEKGQIHLLIA